MVPVPDDELPVLLPEVTEYVPKGRSPLAAAEDWVRTACPGCGGAARRETDTMDTFVDSSWYYLRYADAQNDGAPFDRELVDYWLPVRQYIGGIEHAILHLLYSRFFTKVMNDLGLVGFREPFLRLFTQGMIHYHGAKMSKSRGNVVAPDEMVAQYGADAVRLYVLYMGPAEQDKEWQDSGIEGTWRLLDRIWRLGLEVARARGDRRPRWRRARAHCAPDDRAGHRRHHAALPVPHADRGAVRARERDLRVKDDPRQAADVRFATETAVSLVQPYAPHVAEELWERLGHERLWETPWPEADPAMLERETFELVVQVNGKVRDRVEVGRGALRGRAHRAGEGAAATCSPSSTARRCEAPIVVPRKLVNLVV